MAEKLTLGTNVRFGGVRPLKTLGPTIRFDIKYEENKMTKQKSEGSKTDVIKLLTADHKKVKKLFKGFEDLKDEESGPKKAAIVKQICLELTLHSKAEEAIFYPAARKAIKNDDLMDEADVEHAGAKELISQLQTMSPDETHYHAKVTVLRKYIKHHIREEEGKIFPLVKKSKLDRQLLGEEITTYKSELSKKIPTPKAAKKTPSKTVKKPRSRK